MPSRRFKPELCTHKELVGGIACCAVLGTLWLSFSGWLVGSGIVRPLPGKALILFAIWLIVTILFLAGLGMSIVQQRNELKRRKHAWRQSRGLCRTCAYPIGQSPVCTECGAAVTGKVAQG